MPGLLVRLIRRSTGRIRRVALRLMATATAAALGLILLEAVVRVTHSEYRRMFARYVEAEGDEKEFFCEHDPLLGWRNRPQIQGYFARREFRHHVRHNSYGMRGAEIGLAPEPGRIRVLAVGDSFTWGYGVEEEETFCRLLSKALDVEVLNLGVSGYGTDQELLSLRKVRSRYGARAVIVFFDAATDVSDVRNAHRWGYAKPRMAVASDGSLYLAERPAQRRAAVVSSSDTDRSKNVEHPWFNMLAESSTLFNVTVAGLASRSWSVRNFLQESGIVGAWVAWDDEEVLKHASSENVEAGWEVTFAILAEMKRSLIEYGMDLIVVHIPGKGQVSPRLDLEVFDPQFPPRRLREFCDSAGILFIDTLPELTAALQGDGPEPYYRFDPHLTPTGHHIVARSVARQLRELDDGRWLVGLRSTSVRQ